MEEAIQILWTYARREPINCNGKTVVPTVNNSIAAIRKDGFKKVKKEEGIMKSETEKMKNQ